MSDSDSDTDAPAGGPRSTTPHPSGVEAVAAAESESKTGNARLSTSTAAKAKARDAAAKQRPSEWAKVDHSLEFAADIEQADVRAGFLAQNYTWTLFAPLVVYGLYLLYCEGCKDEMWDFARVAWEGIYAFLTGSRNTGSVVVLLGVTILVTTFIVLKWPRTVYMVDFAVFEPPPEWKVTHDFFMRKSRSAKVFKEESLAFQEKILRSSTLGNDSYFPPGIMNDELDLSIDGARHEAEVVMGGAVTELFKRTGTKPRDIDIVIVNCSLFCPTPSLSSILVNKFKMRHDVLNYSLGGMGCSAGLISVDLAVRALSTRPNSLALVVSTENITQNWYHGNEKSMLISNCLFRCGCSAALLSNRHRDASRAKFKLCNLVRTHMGADDDAYEAVYQCQDPKKNLGVRLSRKIMTVAGDALRSNMTRLGPLVLPVTEQAKFILNVAARKMIAGRLPLPRPLRSGLQAWTLFNLRLPVVGAIIRAVCQLPATAGQPLPPKEGAEGGRVKLDSGKPYIPDFRKCFDYFCVHAGGRAVLDAIEANLQLTKRDLEASRATLARYGNTSSSSIWYEMEYIRTRMGLKKGQKVWQIAFGSGFLCNSAVWKALKTA